MEKQPPNAKAVFDQVLGIESRIERAAYLDQACVADPQLRHKVEALLAAYEQAGSFLEAGPIGMAQTINPPLAERPGTVIGPYKLLEQIGEGGMGTVFMAEQSHPVQRKVALKLIKAGMDSGQVIARFEAERQALALMDHPNIAKVLDAGTIGEVRNAECGVRNEDMAAGAPTTPHSALRTPHSAGRPYFVMELVKGVPITQYCDENHVPPKARLELFTQVCQAVQHAHQKGIIHRDIKPTNVLVALYDDKPVPKVIDFGVAKATGGRLTERTMFTGYGQIVGTIEYMSPEQARLNALDVDTRGDIYSLGVLLYELLTGTTPFDRQRLREAAFDEMLRMIREEEPPKPSTRLSTAEGRASIAANRSMEPAKLSGLVRGELDWIVMKALEKDRNRRDESANGFAMDVQRYLADEPVQACPPSAVYRLRKFARRNKAGLGTTAVLAVAVLVVVGTLGWALRDRVARDESTAREREMRQAKVMGQVDLIFDEIKQLQVEQKWPEALIAARRAEAVLSGGEAGAATTERVSALLKDLLFIERLEQIRMVGASLIGENFDYAGAHRQYTQAFQHYGVDVTELAVEASIDRLKSRPALAIPVAAALDDWVNLPGAFSGRDSTGRRLLMPIARGIDPEPLRDRLRSNWGQPVSNVQEDLRRLADSIDIRAQHPATLVNLARALQRVGQSDSALQLLLKAQYVEPGDFWLTYDLGAVLCKRKDYGSAIRYGTAAVSIRPKFGAAHYGLGFALRHQGKDDEAIAAYRKAIKLDPQFYNAYIGLSNALSGQGKLDDSIDCLRKAIELDPKQSPAHCNIGRDLWKQGKTKEAMACCEKAIQLDPNNARAHGVLGSILCDGLRDYENAAATFRKAIELDPKHAPTYSNLGNALNGQNHFDEAVAAYRKAIELDPKYALARTGLNNALMRKWWANPAALKLQDPKQAVELLKEAVELDSQSCYAWQLLGWIQYRAGNWAASIEALDKSCQLQPGGTGDSFQWIVLALAHARLATHQELPAGERARHQREARRWYEQADKIITNRWQARPSDPQQQAVWDFHAEAKELMTAKDDKK